MSHRRAVALNRDWADVRPTQSSQQMIYDRCRIWTFFCLCERTGVFWKPLWTQTSSHRYYTRKVSPCVFFWCVVKCALCAKTFPHVSHSINGSLWVRWCMVYVFLWVNSLPQVSHLKISFFMWVCIWLFKIHSMENCVPQMSHLKGFPTPRYDCADDWLSQLRDQIRLSYLTLWC